MFARKRTYNTLYKPTTNDVQEIKKRNEKTSGDSTTQVNGPTNNKSFIRP